MIRPWNLLMMPIIAQQSASQSPGPADLNFSVGRRRLISSSRALSIWPKITVLELRQGPVL